MSKRVKFFASHLSLSILVALIIISLVFLVWYPSPLAQAVGVTHIFLMLLAIDVIVGPILGFIVYKEGKKSLKFDLSVIIFIQIAALVYGIFTIEQGRPAWIVYNADRFELIRKNEIIIEKSEDVKSQYQKASWFAPQYVAVEISKDMQQRNNDLFAEVLGGVSLAQRPERYVPITQVKNQIQKRGQDLVDLKKYNSPEQVDQIITRYPEANVWFPLKASAQDMVVLVNRERAEIIKIVDLRPWK